MGNKIKVHYYSVSNNNKKNSLDGLLKILDTYTIAQRTKQIRNGDVSLEHLEQQKTDWFLHFTSARLSNWPGVGQKGQISSDLKLNTGSILTENTYVAFDSKKGIMVLQYAPSSVRASRVFSYFDDYIGQPNAFNYYPVLNNNALQRYAKKYSYTEIEAVIDNVSPADAALFSGSSISGTIRESVKAGITKVNFGFNVNARIKKNKISPNFVTDLVDLLLKRNSTSDKLIVTGRDAADSPIESIDLLADTKAAFYEEKLVTLTPGRRYRRDDMRTILFDALRK